MGPTHTAKFSIHRLIFAIAFLIIFSAVFFLLLQKSVREFKTEEIAKHMNWMGNSVIYFCNVSYDSLARVGGLSDTPRLRLQQLEALEQIDDFARSSDFKIVILEEGDDKSYLLISSFSDIDQQIPVFSRLPLHAISYQTVENVQFNTFVVQFDSWKWRILLFKDSVTYDTLLSRLNIFYISFGVLIGLLCIVIILFFSQLSKTGRILQQSELELKSILDSLAEGVITLDNNGLITQMNPASISICELQKQIRPIGRHICEVLSIRAGKGKRALEKPDFEDGGSNRLFSNTSENFYLITTEGTEKTIQMRFARPLSAEHGLSLVISFHDLSEKIRMQEMMMQSEKMLSVGGLAAGMAHEINNPLAGIMQNAQVIKTRLKDSFPANDKAAAESNTSMESIKTYMKKRKILHFLDNIIDAGSSAAKIVDNMLSFAKKGNSSKNRYDLATLLEKTIELAKSDYDLKKKYDFKQISIIKEFAPDIPNVVCEQSKIMQVIFNVIKNATESMNENTQETHNSELIFRLKPLDKMIQIEIEDNGPGMDDAVRKRVFEPFFTTKDVDKGTGLGLSLSYFIIVEDHQGEMEVESSPGKGSKFIIRLPIF